MMQRGGGRGDVVGRAVGHPVVDHALIQRDDLGVLGPGLGVQQDECPNPVRISQRHPQGDESALGHAADDRPVDAEVIEEGDAVRGQVPVGERLPVVDRVAETALVPGDHPVALPQRLHLRVEHGAVHEEAVGQHDRRALATRVVVGDLLAVGHCGTHRASPRLAGLPGSPGPPPPMGERRPLPAGSPEGVTAGAGPPPTGDTPRPSPPDGWPPPPGSGPHPGGHAVGGAGPTSGPA